MIPRTLFAKSTLSCLLVSVAPRDAHFRSDRICVLFDLPSSLGFLYFIEHDGVCLIKKKNK